MKKVLFIFGTRPEAIKMAPVIKELRIKNLEFRIKVCITAQHRFLLDDVLETFDIKPDYDLDIMTENQSLFKITTTVMNRLEPILKKEKPDMVLVHGDTTTTFASTLSSYYLKIPVGHIEAGLRSYNNFNPYPEEINRRLTDATCDIYFCPTSTAKEALLKENINPKNICVTGNTVIDALQMILKRKHRFQNPILRKLFNCQLHNIESDVNPNKKRQFTSSLPSLPTIPCLLVTAHRRENFGMPIKNICNAIKRISQRFPNCKIIYPVHPNPNIKIPVNKILGKIENVNLVQPLNYSDFANLMRISYIILTDSGGLQEEAPSLGKPVLVMRGVTERPEAIASGTVKLVGTDEKIIFNEVAKLMTNKQEYNKMAKSTNQYGDGFAAKRTVGFIEYYFGISDSRPKEFLAT